MSKLEKVRDHYWIEFLESVHSTPAYWDQFPTLEFFWRWFYDDVCKADKTIAQQKFDEAMKAEE